jgi:asparagine N-glycosylation enzyme membrane subunit Stt3
MFSKILADTVLLIHFAFVAFAVFGGISVLYKRSLAWFHIPVVLWSSVINLGGWICPLTPLENYFRSQAGRAGYEGGFVQHYIESLVYPGGMPRNFELIAGISILAWNGLVYLFVLLYWKRRQP